MQDVIEEESAWWQSVKGREVHCDVLLARAKAARLRGLCVDLAVQCSEVKNFNHGIVLSFTVREWDEDARIEMLRTDREIGKEEATDGERASYWDAYGRWVDRGVVRPND